MPSAAWFGSPSNIATMLLLLGLVFSRQWIELVYLTYGVMVIIFLITISTINGYINTDEAYHFNINPFVVFLRIQICYLALRRVNDLKVVQRAILWVGTLASFFAIGQFYFPIFRELTLLHYLAPERQSVFNMDIYGDDLIRIIGTFENPSSVALVSIALIIFAMHLYLSNVIGLRLAVALSLCNLFAGLLTLSKIYFLILPLFVFYLFAYRFYKTLSLIMLIIIFAGSWFFVQDNVFVDVIKYALNSATNFPLAFDGRYTSEQIATVEKSLFFGYGLISLNNIIINDSIYLTLFYLIGGIGFSFIAVFLITWIAKKRRSLPLSFYLIVFAVLLAGLGSNSIIGYRVDIIISSMCASLYFGSLVYKSKL